MTANIGSNEYRETTNANAKSFRHSSSPYIRWTLFASLAWITSRSGRHCDHLIGDAHTSHPEREQPGVEVFKEAGELLPLWCGREVRAPNGRVPFGDVHVDIGRGCRPDRLTNPECDVLLARSRRYCARTRLRARRNARRASAQREPYKPADRCHREGQEVSSARSS